MKLFKPGTGTVSLFVDAFRSLQRELSSWPVLQSRMVESLTELHLESISPERLLTLKLAAVAPEKAKRLSNAPAALTPSLLSAKVRHHLTLNFDITSSSRS
jgi:hypothetical protein